MKRIFGAIWRRMPFRASLMRKVGLMPRWLKGPLLTKALKGFLRHASIDGDDLLKTNLGIRGGPVISVPLGVGYEYIMGSPDSMHGEKPTLQLAELLMKQCASFMDVGSFLGYFIWFLKAAIGSGKCVAVEPDPKFSALLRQNLETTCMNNAVVYEVAAAKESSTTRFFANLDNPSMSTVLPNFADDARRVEVTVRTEPLARLVSENQLDRILVKMDVEGAEVSAIAGLVGSRDQVEFLIVELLDSSLAGGAVEAIEDLMAMKGLQISDYALLDFSSHSRESTGRNWLFHRMVATEVQALERAWRAGR